MTTKEAILFALDMSDMITKAYLKDLSDADLLIRAVPGQNNIAWQLGHLVNSERHMIEQIRPGSSPALPEGFDEGHGRQSFTVDDPSKFYSVAKYIELIDAQRAATKAVLESMDEAALDAPSPESFASMAPKVGYVFMLAGQHFMMHAGQYVPVRRKLEKPTAI
jgi:hypothetical protein